MVCLFSETEKNLVFFCEQLSAGDSFWVRGGSSCRRGMRFSLVVNFLYSKLLLSSFLGIFKMDTADCPFFFKMQSPLVDQGQTERLFACERHELPGMIQIPSLPQEAVNSCEKRINCS